MIRDLILERKMEAIHERERAEQQEAFMREMALRAIEEEAGKFMPEGVWDEMRPWMGEWILSGDCKHASTQVTGDAWGVASFSVMVYLKYFGRAGDADAFDLHVSEVILCGKNNEVRKNSDGEGQAADFFYKMRQLKEEAEATRRENYIFQKLMELRQAETVEAARAVVLEVLGEVQVDVDAWRANLKAREDELMVKAHNEEKVEAYKREYAEVVRARFEVMQRNEQKVHALMAELHHEVEFWRVEYMGGMFWDDDGRMLIAKEEEDLVLYPGGDFDFDPEMSWMVIDPVHGLVETRFAVVFKVKGPFRANTSDSYELKTILEVPGHEYILAEVPFDKQQEGRRRLAELELEGIPMEPEKPELEGDFTADWSGIRERVFFEVAQEYE